MQTVKAALRAAMQRKYADEREELQKGLLWLPTETQRYDTGATVELARYLVWLAGQQQQVSTEALGVLVLAVVRKGMWWSEVAEDMGLPVPPDWEL